LITALELGKKYSSIYGTFDSGVLGIVSGRTFFNTGKIGWTLVMRLFASRLKLGISLLKRRIRRPQRNSHI